MFFGGGKDMFFGGGGGGQTGNETTRTGRRKIVVCGRCGGGRASPHENPSVVFRLLFVVDVPGRFTERSPRAGDRRRPYGTSPNSHFSCLFLPSVLHVFVIRPSFI